MAAYLSITDLAGAHAPSRVDDRPRHRGLLPECFGEGAESPSRTGGCTRGRACVPRTRLARDTNRFARLRQFRIEVRRSRLVKTL